MAPSPARTILRNLGLLLFAILPFAILVGGAIAKVWPPEWARVSTASTGILHLDALAFAYLTIAPPVAIGGAVHQFVLWRAERGHWGFVLVTSLLVPVPLLLGPSGPAALFTWRFLVPMLVALIAYTWLVRTPTTRRVDSESDDFRAPKGAV